MSSKNFASSGSLLFLDVILTSVGGWFFWIMLSKFAHVSEVGQASTIFGFVLIVSSVARLGFEYPMLKKSSSHKVEIMGSILVLELVLILVLLPIVLYSTENFYDGSLEEYNWLTLPLIFAHTFGLLSRFVLLGIIDVRKVFFIDTIGMAFRFIIGYFLIINGFGVSAILLAFLIQYTVVLIMTLIIANKTFKFKIGSIVFIKNIFLDGLINFPAKFGRVLLIGLSVVFLAAAGVSDTEVGIFYITVTLSIVLGGGLATSLSYMVIPLSSISKKDLSADSWRIGISLTAPIITALVVGPDKILSMIGSEYVQGELVMLVLAIGIFPLAITMNAISMFNNQNESKKILIIGIIEMSAFLVAAWALIPLYESLGAGFAILIALCAAAVPSMMWSNRLLAKYVIISGISILIGWMSGIFMEMFLKFDSSFGMVISAIITLIVIISLKNISARELCELVKNIAKRN